MQCQTVDAVVAPVVRAGLRLPGLVVVGGRAGGVAGAAGGVGLLLVAVGLPLRLVLLRLAVVADHAGHGWRCLPGEGGDDRKFGLYGLLVEVVGDLAAGVAAGGDIAVDVGDGLRGGLAGGGL